MSDSEEDVASPASEAGWRVRILDLSGGEDDNIIEEIGGFHELEHANAFVRAYVRDSIEICRAPGTRGRDVLESWLSFGENAEVIDAGDEGWRSATEVNAFVDDPATPMERDWRALDPRRLIEDDEFPSDDDAAPVGEA